MNKAGTPFFAARLSMKDFSPASCPMINLARFVSFFLSRAEVFLAACSGCGAASALLVAGISSTRRGRDVGRRAHQSPLPQPSEDGRIEGRLRIPSRS